MARNFSFYSIILFDIVCFTHQNKADNPSALPQKLFVVNWNVREQNMDVVDLFPPQQLKFSQ